MEAYLSGIGWVTGAGFGWGRQGGECVFCDQPLPPLARKDVFAGPNQRFGRMTDYSKLGLAAVAFALRDAGLEAWSEKRNVGVVAATRLGCLATDLDYHQTVLLQGGGLASPNLFAYTLANCFLGDVAIQFGFTGSSIAVNEGLDGAEGADGLDGRPAPGQPCLPQRREGRDAIRLALEDLAMGEADAMLAGVCDLPAPAGFSGQPELLAGAAFLVLSAAPSAAGKDYGSVAFAGERLLFNGSQVRGLAELVRAALARRED